MRAVRIIRRLLRYLAFCVLALVALLALRGIYRTAYRAAVMARLNPGHEIVIGGKTLNQLQGDMHFYFGSLHSHTTASDGFGTAPQMLFLARHVMGCDFYAITDHAALLSDSEWKETGRQTARATEDGRFVALRGFEAGREEPHIGVFQTETFTRLEPVREREALLRWVVSHRGLAELNHPAPQHVNAVIPGARGMEELAVIETGNKESGNAGNRYLPQYQRALDLGALVAPADNHDAHSWWEEVFNPHRTVIIAAALTPPALLEAVRARRIYSSDDPNQKIVFKLGDAWMGSLVTLAEPGPATFSVYVEDDEPIVNIDLVSKSGRVIARKAAGARLVAWEPTVEVSGETFFYLKITARDLLLDEVFRRYQVTVTAPIWISVGAHERTAPPP